ncbi:MutS domain V [Zobellia uliginosa]|uniref:MutS domain V n=1 Tax=Zobellia uliginosa TaxID=143224 RepID=A0ABY1KZE0_9FLAO|nr:DNA mismatch repair protein MutS [Zobellia uliginosa]SIS81434.1 MutS domain V [Zobellia uliginosa]
MQQLNSFYRGEIEKYSKELAKIKKKLFASSMLRLAIFGVAGFAIYWFFGDSKWVMGVILVTIVLFLFLVTRHAGLQYQRDRLMALLRINETELDVLDRRFYDLPQGEEFKDPLHYFSQDIDLFGRGSFFQYANRTALKQGAETFAALFKANEIEGIEQKQEAIKELAQMPEWRQNFSAIASLTRTEGKTDAIVKWLADYTAFVPKIMRYLPMVFSGVSALLFGLYFADLAPESALILWLVVGMGITGVYTKKITKLGSDASKVQSTFQQYNKLLTLIENTEFTSEYLKDLKGDVLHEREKTSLIIAQFSKQLNSLDKNNNVIYLFLANGFMLRTLTHCYEIEKWIAAHGNFVEKWFDAIAYFDAYNSLGNFAFNHPDYHYPAINDGAVVLRSEGAGHPLLNPEKSVLNDFKIDREQFFIVTGANMAGKSTFLRTVSLQIVMANVGLPLCAQKVEYSPIKLITSMRTTDSLTDDESYFFSELKRLKFIVDEIQNDRYFIVLDEILKGTNSTDKAEGSRKFVERLVASKSTGIIATHDLSLCEVAHELPQVENHYFDAEIIDDELHFDYKFKDGICQNMNASFLLKKMQIVE